jgi:hypothetical protein
MRGLTWTAGADNPPRRDLAPLSEASALMPRREVSPVELADACIAAAKSATSKLDLSDAYLVTLDSRRTAGRWRTLIRSRCEWD